jgi:hypothetical protein
MSKTMNGKTIMEVVLEAANDARVDKVTMNKLEALPEELTATQIRQLRERSNLSRSVIKNFFEVLVILIILPLVLLYRLILFLLITSWLWAIPLAILIWVFR